MGRKNEREDYRRLREEIRGSGKDTLGAFMATLNPELRHIRGQHTDRKMYEDEFDAIIAAQKLAPWLPAKSRDGQGDSGRHLLPAAVTILAALDRKV